MSPMVTDYILCSSIKDTGSLIFLAFAFIIAPLIGLFLHAMVPCPSAAWHAAGVTSRIGFSSGSVAIRPPDHPKCPVLAGRSLLRRFLKEVARFAIRLHLIATWSFWNLGAARLLRNLLGATFGIQGPIWKHGANTFGPKGTIWEHLTTALGSLVDQLGTIKVWTLDHHLSEHTFVLQTAFFLF